MTSYGCEHLKSDENISVVTIGNNMSIKKLYDYKTQIT